jgi:hypothetical protein
MIALDLTAKGGKEMAAEKVPFHQFLRELADWYEAHPLVPEPYWLTGDISVYVSYDPKAVFRSLGSFEKIFDDAYFRTKVEVGGRTLVISTQRENVCVAKVVGKKHVPETVIPSEYKPERVIAAHDEDIVEWDCSPIIAPEGNNRVDDSIAVATEAVDAVERRAGIDMAGVGEREP